MTGHQDRGWKWLGVVLALVAVPLLARAATTGRYVYRTGELESTTAADNAPDRDFFSWLPWKKDTTPRPLPAAEAMELKLRVRELCRQLLATASEPLVDDYTLTVNSFVNLNDLYATSALGRLLGEQMIGELQSAGAEVIDVRKSAGLMVREGYGEYGLSRHMEELSYIHATQAMVAGTYSQADGQLFLNVRVLRNTDGAVLAHGSLVCPLDDLTRRLLADEAAPPPPAGVVTVRSANE